MKKKINSDTIVSRFDENFRRVKWWDDKLTEEKEKFQSFVERNLALAHVKGRIRCAKEQLDHTATELRGYAVIPIVEVSDMTVLTKFESLYGKFGGSLDFSGAGNHESDAYQKLAKEARRFGFTVANGEEKKALQRTRNLRGF